jgi:hypothetical protein
MAEAFEPFKLRLDDPDQAKELLEDFEAGRIAVSVTREEPDTLICAVHLIENLLERNKYFLKIQDGKPLWGFPGVPIDREIADVAVNTLRDMGHKCHAISTTMRTREEKIAKSLRDLGFIIILEEKES